MLTRGGIHITRALKPYREVFPITKRDGPMATTERPCGQLTQWLDCLANHLPHLSRPQRRSLALWSYAATLTEHIGLTTCAAFLAETTETSEAAMRHRLREFYRPAALKRGAQRRQLDVRLLFGPLLTWLLHLLRPPEIVLALDPTLCRDRLAVLAVAVVAHGCAIPVAWTAVRANEAGAWRTGNPCSSGSTRSCRSGHG